MYIYTHTHTKVATGDSWSSVVTRGLMTVQEDEVQAGLVIHETLCISLSLSLPLPVPLSLSHTHTHTLSLIHTHTQSLSLSPLTKYRRDWYT